MSTVIDVGGIKVTALNDGEVHLPPMYYPGLDREGTPPAPAVTSPAANWLQRLSAMLGTQGKAAGGPR